MGWFFITILLPLVAPLLALLVFKLFPQVSPMPLIAPFKDGHLSCFLASLALTLLAAILYAVVHYI